MDNSSQLHPTFQHSTYLFRRKLLKLVGGAFHVYADDGSLLLYGKQRAFKLREDMSIFTDESESETLIRIRTPQIIDIGATYGVLDVHADEMVGAIRRKALKSMIRDEYVFIDAGGQEVGLMTEQSMMGAMASRFINLIPQRYRAVTTGGEEAATIKQHFNPLILKYTLSVPEADPLIDRRLLIAACILLCAIEGRQQN